MDVTILSANASQLKVILKEPDSEYYTVLLVLVSISMILQVWYMRHYKPALDYKPRILRIKKVSCNTNRSAV